MAVTAADMFRLERNVAKNVAGCAISMRMLTEFKHHMRKVRCKKHQMCEREMTACMRTAV